MCTTGKRRVHGELARYICSEGASFMTGTDLLIDGGWVAQ